MFVDSSVSHVFNLLKSLLLRMFMLEPESAITFIQVSFTLTLKTRCLVLSHLTLWTRMLKSSCSSSLLLLSLIIQSFLLFFCVLFGILGGADLVHTALKWYNYPHFLHSLPYAGHVSLPPW